ncbi:hypothetical protein T05_14024 [Trichinella murrelli]|uniref:Uncharacterized protein n=1 Tax=Trichinella murrelli TaxID=144512 RepID=A0A0V0TP64_9BILA|nr:hypothetical protein T05_14024 [Trichinella murrelli]
MGSEGKIGNNKFCEPKQEKKSAERKKWKKAKKQKTVTFFGSTINIAPVDCFQILSPYLKRLSVGVQTRARRACLKRVEYVERRRLEVGSGLSERIVDRHRLNLPVDQRQFNKQSQADQHAHLGRAMLLFFVLASSFHFDSISTFPSSYIILV